jgi:RND family efflux transporter MFP subunit
MVGPRALLPLLVASALACGGNEYVEPPPPNVVVGPPVQETVTEYLEFTGATEPINKVEIRARVRGFLLEVSFEEGEAVEEGALLFRIDPAEFEAAVHRAEANLALARASRGIARATHARLKKALETRAVSELEVLEAEAQVQGSQAQVQAREAELERAQLDLGYTEILAPIAGRTSRSLVDPGNLVGSGEPTLLTTIVQYDPIYASFDLSERDALRILEGTAKARAAAADPDRARARVELGTANEEGYPHIGVLDYADPTVDRETGTVLLRAVFPNPEPVVLIPGLFVRVRIPAATRENALLVSARAVGADQGGSYVLVVGEGDVVEQRSVSLGARLGDLRVVEQGLEPGDRVIIEGLLRARPGARVTPQPAGAAPGSIDVAAPPDPDAG